MTRRSLAPILLLAFLAAVAVAVAHARPHAKTGPAEGGRVAEERGADSSGVGGASTVAHAHNPQRALNEGRAILPEPE